MINKIRDIAYACMLRHTSDNITNVTTHVREHHKSYDTHPRTSQILGHTSEHVANFTTHIQEHHKCQFIFIHYTTINRAIYYSYYSYPITHAYEMQREARAVSKFP